MKIDKEKMRKLKVGFANTMLILSIFSVMSLVLITLYAPTATATTYYVNPGESIQEAIEMAGSYDTVYVYAGTYNEKLTINNIGHSRDHLTLQGESRNNTTVQPPPLDPGTVITISASWVNVTGFTITNGSTGTELSSGSNIFFNNTVSYNGAIGVHVKGSNNRVLYNRFIANGQGDWFTHSGVSLSGSYHNVENNYFESNNPKSIRVYHGFNFGNNYTISNNTIVNGPNELYLQNIGHSVIDNNTMTNTNGIHVEGSSNVTISNNTLVGGGGIWIGKSSYGGYSIVNNTIYNNTIIDCSGTGVTLTALSLHVISDNNISNCNDDGIYLSASSNNTISNNTIINNSGNGITMISSDYNHIINNNIIDSNTGTGISLYYYKGNGLHYGDNDFNNITGNKITNNGGGIYLRLLSSNNTIMGNNISHNGFGIKIHPHYGLASPCDNNKIIGNNIKYNDLDGIWTVHSRNNVIADNNISYNGLVPTDDNGFGIYLDQGSDNNTIVNNTLLNNTNGGIYLKSDSNDNTIQNNTISLGTYGINLGYMFPWNSVSTPICNNTFEENWIYNTTYGIYIGNGYGNVINDTTIEGPEEYGLFINRNLETNFKNYLSKNNTVNGELLYYYYNKQYLILNKIENLTQHYVTNVGKVTFYACSNITLINKTISNGTIGIFIHSSENITLDHNIIFNITEVGLFIGEGYWHSISLNNTVDGEPIHYYCNISDITIANKVLDTWNVSNVGKITLAYCKNVFLINNAVSNNDFGIFLWGSEDITMWDNNMSTPKLAGLFIEEGFHHYISPNNTANGEIIHYFTDIHGNESNPILINTSSLTNTTNNQHSNVGLISFANCSYLIVENNTLNNNYGSGLFIASSFNITVRNNTATSNCDGMVLISSTNVNVTKNKFSSNTRDGYGKKSGLHLRQTGKNDVNYVVNNSNLNGSSYGIYVESSHNDVIAYHNQTLPNIYLDYSSPYIHDNYFKGGTMIDGHHSNPIIENNIFKDGGIAIYHLSYSNRSAKILNNYFDGFNLAAIYLKDSSSPEISHNTITNINYDGIDIYHKDSAPYVHDNNISNVGYMGIQLEDSNATIENNNIWDAHEGINVYYNPFDPGVHTRWGIKKCP